MENRSSKIGIFDSGFGGLTIYKDIHSILPQYDYIYLGDNARNPYGNKSFTTVYLYTLQCVNWLISQGCDLIILACNTASARALRSIQINHWQEHIDKRRILGVIRPTVEYIAQQSLTKHIGIVATEGTVRSNTYTIEFEKLDRDIKVTQKACPLWVPLIENDRISSVTERIIAQDLRPLFKADKAIDSLLLGCTHYPHIIDKIKKYTPSDVTIYSQGKIVAASLKNYLEKHQWLENRLSIAQTELFYTSDEIENFEEMGSQFLQRKITAQHINTQDL